jgi:hypothetical protein
MAEAPLFHGVPTLRLRSGQAASKPREAWGSLYGDGAEQDQKWAGSLLVPRQEKQVPRHALGAVAPTSGSE